MNRRKYSSQYKGKAIAFSEEKKNVAAAARELGVRPRMIHRWKKEKEKYAHNSFPSYGKPKMTDQEREIARLKKELKDAQLETEILKRPSAFSPRAARMMKSMGLKARKQQKFKATTDSKHNYPIAPNLLNQDFCVEKTNQVWVSDKSYDLVKQSMSRKGNCWENAVAESFFKSLKVEWVYKKQYKCFSDAEFSIFKWIETWYNRNRRHSALNYMTINEFELENNNLKLAA